MFSFNRNVLAIVVSDIHLGDIYCKTDEFELFLSKLLQEIKYNNFPYFKSLIILGDFFDLIMNSFWNICNNKKYIRIYELLQAINYNDVLIVFVLGNHEISTTGFYNIYFKLRKKEFLDKMRENDFSFNLLNESNLCQYIILGRNNQNILTLYLFDSIDMISSVRNGKVFLKDKYFEYPKNIPFNGKYYFLTHGFQFEDWDTHHFICAPWWNLFMGLDEDTKEGLNKFWFELKNDKENFDYDSFYYYIKSKGIKMTNLKSRDIKKFIQNELYKKNERFYINAVEFLNKKQLYFITHVIFGHTHDILQIKYEDLLIMNPGCWLQNKKACYIEILSDGDYLIKEI